MFIASHSIAPRRSVSYLPSLLLLPLVFLLPPSPASAQGVGTGRDISSGTGGSHTIQGRIYFETKPPEGIRIRIRLQEPNTGDLTTVTDQDFVFRFTNLNAGYYTLIIDAGNQYEVYREVVPIDRETSRSPRVFTVPVYLREKGVGPAPKPGVIDSALVGDAPKAAVDLYTKAVESAGKGDHKKAVEHLSNALAIHPQFPLALGELGLQYLKLGQPDKAIEPLKVGIQLAPKDFAMRLNYGIALSGKRNYAEAEPELREALKLKSAAPTAHMYLGITLLNLSRDEKTKQFNADKYAEAQKELETAVTSGKDEVAQAHRYLGGIYWGNKDYKRAADEFEVYLKLTPKAADAEKIRAIIKDLRSKQ